MIEGDLITLSREQLQNLRDKHNMPDIEQAKRANEAGWNTPFVPRETQPALFIDVITATRDPDAPPHDARRINYNSHRARKWLESHCTWALRTGYTVHLASVS